MQRRALLALIPLLAVSLGQPAQAQVHRRFPATALRGEFEVTAFPQIRLNRQPAQMAPGGRIFGDTNLLQQPGALTTGQRFIVNYTIEPVSGLVMDVWLLNPAELANKVWPTTPQEAASWQFDWSAQTWTKP
jgi:hypothetical protein